MQNVTLFRNLTSYLTTTCYVMWNEKGWGVRAWTKHYNSKCKLSEFCFISDWLSWVGVLFHTGTRYFSCCILKAEFYSKWWLQILYCTWSCRGLNGMLCNGTHHKNFAVKIGPNKTPNTVSIFLSRDIINVIIIVSKTHCYSRKEFLLHLQSRNWN